MHRASVCLALTSAIALAGCWEGISRDVVPTILSTKGKVVCSLRESGEFRPLSAQTRLGGGATVRTLTDAESNLEIIPGVLARLYPDSELRLHQLTITKDGNESGDAMRERTAGIELSRGGMVVLFEGAAKFTINTPHATITVLPSCLFRVDVDSSKTRLICVRGKVYAKPRSGRAGAILGGFLQEWPSEHDPFPAAEDIRAQKEIGPTLETAHTLHELDVAQHDRLPAN